MNLWRIAVDTGTGRPASDPEPVTNGVRGLAYARFSADGSRLAVMAYEPTREQTLFDIDAAGTGVVGARGRRGRRRRRDRHRERRMARHRARRPARLPVAQPRRPGAERRARGARLGHLTDGASVIGAADSSRTIGDSLWQRHGSGVSSVTGSFTTIACLARSIPRLRQAHRSPRRVSLDNLSQGGARATRSAIETAPMGGGS